MLFYPENVTTNDGCDFEGDGDNDDEEEAF